MIQASVPELLLNPQHLPALEDKFKRLLLRFERIQRRHDGMKVLAYTLINLRTFCGTQNSQPVTE